jgi:tRNA pseudouridine55 synthase
MNGFLLIDKPDGWTSHDIVGYMRKVTGEKRIGHAGTLDPFATGLLIVAIGRQYTKRLEEFKNLDKEYVATIHLGAVSDTQDRTGVITMHDSHDTTQFSQTNIEAVLQSFVGAQEQIPPMYSAKKVDGKRLHALARAGKEVERKPSQVIIHSIELLSYDGQLVTVKCHVSPGTYIRTLAHDIGQALGVGAYCEELRRTKIGTYCVEDGISPKILVPEIVEKRLFS